jgi:Response regulator receiver domain
MSYKGQRPPSRWMRSRSSERCRPSPAFFAVVFPSFLARVFGLRPMLLTTVTFGFLGFVFADDHVVFTDGIVRLLRDRFDVVGTVADGSELPDAVRRLRPDVVVMDISMPG